MMKRLVLCALASACLMAYAVELSPDICSICREPLLDGDPEVISVACNHQFHKSCIQQWANGNHRDCPLCRQPHGVAPIPQPEHAAAPIPQPPLISAVQRNDLDEVMRLIQDVPEGAARAAFVRQVDTHGSTALLWAAMRGHIDIVRILLDAVPEGEARAAFVRQVNQLGATALHLAAMGGHIDIVNVLMGFLSSQEQRDIAQDILDRLDRDGISITAEARDCLNNYVNPHLFHP